MPVSLRNARCTVFDGPPRIVGLGLNLCDGRIIGVKDNQPADIFEDPAFDRARNMANNVTDYIRRHGEFMPARLGPDELEYTTLPQVTEKLKSRFEKAS